MFEARIKEAYIGGWVIDGEKAITGRRVYTLGDSSVEMQVFIRQIRSFFEFLAFLQHFSNHLWCEDLLFDCFGDVQTERIQFFGETQFLVGGRHLLSQNIRKIIKIYLIFTILKTRILKQAKEAIGQIEIVLRSRCHDSSEDAKECGDR